MIVYAFYGLGKTEFTKKSGLKCVDADEMDFIMNPDFPKCYIDFIKEHDAEDTVVFINARPYAIDFSIVKVAFLPSDINCIKKRLLDKGIDHYFVSDIVMQWHDIKCDLDDIFGLYNTPEILLDEDEYLLNYTNLIKKFTTKKVVLNNKKE